MSCCRACMLSAFSAADKLYALTGEWIRIYSFCTSIELTEHDCLPKTLCQTCYDLLSKFYSFKNQCLKSNIALLEKYENGVGEEKFSGILASDIKKEDDIDNFFDHFSDDVGLGEIGIKQESEGEESEWRCERKYTSRKTKNKRAHVKKEKKHKAKHRVTYNNVRKRREKRFFCPKKRCQKKFTHEDSLEAHMLVYHKGLSIEIACHKCKDKKFKSFTELRTHDVVVHQRQECKCETCGKICKSLIALKYHLKTHENICAYVCHTCGKAVKSKQTLQSHEETHREDRSRDHGCEKCGKTFLTRKQMKKHMHFHEAKTHVCDVCAKGFSTKQGLKSHAVVHMEVKPYPCALCNKRYSSQWFLKEHMRIHRGERPFGCAHCPMTFSSKQYLVGHARTHEAGAARRAGGSGAAAGGAHSSEASSLLPSHLHHNPHRYVGIVPAAVSLEEG